MENKGLNKPSPFFDAQGNPTAEPVILNPRNQTCSPDYMERAVPILPVDNLYLAKLFYVDGLGFQVVYEASDDGVTGIMGLARGAIRLTLDCPMAGHGRNVCVMLEVESADFYYEEWRHKVKVDRPPHDEMWNARTFDLSDPFGNTIFIIGPKTSQS